jgi:hypothetical protein
MSGKKTLLFLGHLLSFLSLPRWIEVSKEYKQAA